MFCVGPNRKRKSPDKIESLRSWVERPPVPGGPGASPSGILGNPFKSMRLSPIPKTGHDQRTPKRKREHQVTLDIYRYNLVNFFPSTAFITDSSMYCSDFILRDYVTLICIT